VPQEDIVVVRKLWSTDDDAWSDRRARRLSPLNQAQRTIISRRRADSSKRTYLSKAGDEGNARVLQPIVYNCAIDLKQEGTAAMVVGRLGTHPVVFKPFRIVPLNTTGSNSHLWRAIVRRTLTQRKQPNQMDNNAMASTTTNNILAKEDESDAEIQVRREDQDKINRFARLNARYEDLKIERRELKRALEGLDDAGTELMMGTTGDDDDAVVMILTGEAFLETSEDDAVQFCEQQVAELQADDDKLQAEEAAILAEQDELKKVLYGRFGKSINLETS
jgi:prefoldin subunit 4